MANHTDKRSTFASSSGYLDPIIQRKKREVAERAAKFREKSGRFAESLKNTAFAIIAEIKRKSPSNGAIGTIADPVALARQYVLGGASAVSVLTDEEGFGGSLEDLRAVSEGTSIPILQKDFIVDLFQLEEAQRCGADAVLLIVAILQEKTALFLKRATALGLDALVEVHDERELQIAVDAGAAIIGVNTRNLDTFEIDLSCAEKLIASIPSHCIKVAESGIRTQEDLERMRRAGYDAVLIGQTLVESGDPILTLQRFLCER
jgi:indole-3-glycerol phosphate synthase